MTTKAISASKKAVKLHGRRSKPPTNPDMELLNSIVEKKFTGKNISEIADLLSLNRDTVYRYMRSTEFKEAMLNELRFHISQLYPAAIAALEHQLTEGNMDAVKTVFKTAGLLDVVAESGKQEQQLVVVLPGAQAPEKVIEVQSETEECPEEN